jgi:hypothetical protein
MGRENESQTPYCGNCGGNAVSGHDATCDRGGVLLDLPLNFLRGKLYNRIADIEAQVLACEEKARHVRHCTTDEYKNRVIEFVFTESDKIRAKSLGVSL